MSFESLIHKHPTTSVLPVGAKTSLGAALTPLTLAQPGPVSTARAALGLSSRNWIPLLIEKPCKWGSARVPSVVCRKCWDICVVTSNLIEPGCRAGSALRHSLRFPMTRSLISTCRALKYHDTVLLLMKINLDLCSLVCWHLQSSSLSQTGLLLMCRWSCSASGTEHRETPGHSLSLQPVQNHWGSGWGCPSLMAPARPCWPGSSICAAVLLFLPWSPPQDLPCHGYKVEDNLAKILFRKLWW